MARTATCNSGEILLHGKLGGLVFKVVNGRQTYSLAPQPRNLKAHPVTKAEAERRNKLAVAVAYRNKAKASPKHLAYFHKQFKAQKEALTLNGFIVSQFIKGQIPEEYLTF